MLTAKSSLEDRIEGLNAGADYYLTKPFALEELEARVRSLLRREFVSRGAPEWRTLWASVPAFSRQRR